jgi:hypothetical protein
VMRGNLGFLQPTRGKTPAWQRDWAPTLIYKAGTIRAHPEVHPCH